MEFQVVFNRHSDTDLSLDSVSRQKSEVSSPKPGLPCIPKHGLSRRFSLSGNRRNRPSRLTPTLHSSPLSRILSGLPSVFTIKRSSSNVPYLKIEERKRHGWTKGMGRWFTLVPGSSRTSVHLWVLVRTVSL